MEKLFCSVEDKEKNVIHIRALKQALNNGLKFKKLFRVIKFQQKAWLKSYIDMNAKLRKEAKISLSSWIICVPKNDRKREKA